MYKIYEFGNFRVIYKALNAPKKVDINQNIFDGWAKKLTMSYLCLFFIRI